MSPGERLDALIDGYRTMARISPDGATEAFTQAMVRKNVPADVAATFAVAVERLATQGDRR
jgi:hypothetical protein